MRRAPAAVGSGTVNPCAEDKGSCPGGSRTEGELGRGGERRHTYAPRGSARRSAGSGYLAHTDHTAVQHARPGGCRTRHFIARFASLLRDFPLGRPSRGLEDCPADTGVDTNAAASSLDDGPRAGRTVSSAFWRWCRWNTARIAEHAPHTKTRGNQAGVEARKTRSMDERLWPRREGSVGQRIIMKEGLGASRASARRVEKHLEMEGPCLLGGPV